MLVIVTGCNKKPAEVMKDAFKSLENLDSLSSKVLVEIEGKDETGDAVTGNVTIDIKEDKKFKITKMDLSMNVAGLLISSNSYIQENDNTITTFSRGTAFGITSDWEKNEVEKNSDYEDYNINTTDLEKAINESTTIEEVDSDINGSKKYEVLISKDKINDILKSQTSEADIESDYTYKNDLKINVYVKDNKLSKVVMNIGDVIENTEDTAYTKFILTMDFYDYNNSSITIPSEILNIEE